MFFQISQLISCVFQLIGNLLILLQSFCFLTLLKVIAVNLLVINFMYFFILLTHFHYLSYQQFGSIQITLTFLSFWTYKLSGKSVLSTVCTIVSETIFFYSFLFSRNKSLSSEFCGINIGNLEINLRFCRFFSRLKLCLSFQSLMLIQESSETLKIDHFFDKYICFHFLLSLFFSCSNLLKLFSSLMRWTFSLRPEQIFIIRFFIYNYSFLVKYFLFILVKSLPSYLYFLFLYLFCNKESHKKFLS